MKKILNELYYGNICPNEQVIMEGSDYAEALKTILGAEDFINRQLDKLGQAAFKRYMEAYTDMISITSREMFTQGFRLGLRMGVEATEDDAANLRELISTTEE